MSQDSGWIKVEFLWYSTLVPQPQMLSSWVSHSQINLSWLLYWQTQSRIWQGKPVTYIPRVKPPFLSVFRSFLTATAVEGDIFRNLRQEDRKLLYWRWLHWIVKTEKGKDLMCMLVRCWKKNVGKTLSISLMVKLCGILMLLNVPLIT